MAGLWSNEPSLAVVGATGAVGREMLDILAQRRFPHRSISLLASERSTGSELIYRGEPQGVQLLTPDSFAGINMALFSAGSETARRFVPAALQAGCTVIDNSSAYRAEQDVPLVIPEINGAILEERSPPLVIANPNCSTIILLMAITPIHRAFGVERAVVSTYQAASGAGAHAMAELLEQTRQVLDRREPTCRVFKQQYAFNLFSHDSPIQDDGYNLEERKMIDETRKIWDDPNVRLTATCIRVPVMRAHCESVNLTLRSPVDVRRVRQVLEESPGVTVVDDPQRGLAPTPLEATGCDDVLVGRIRADRSQISDESGRCFGLDLFIAGDQLRKGAALNAVQIAERLTGNA